jgi:hypothetical protein
MEASPVTRRLLARAAFWDWTWWKLPPVLRFYVGVIPVAALTLIGYALSQTTWTLADVVKFLLLLGCGLISVAATPRTAYVQGTLTRDFITGR